MAYKYSGRIIRAGKAWKDNDGITHPSSWMLWDAAYKASIGLVWEDDPAPFDSRFYWSADVPKSLDDVTEEDDSVTLGLKSQWKNTIKQQAAGLLAPTDWYVVRKSETDTAIPANVLQYRADVRAASGTIEAAIDAAADHAAFVALFDTPEDGVAPINDWPEEL